MSRLNSTGDSQPEPEPAREELPPGQFLSDQLQSDTTRFLEEVKDVVRRRWEAGLGRDQ